MPCCLTDARGALLCYEALAELQVFLGDASGARATIATALRTTQPRDGRFLRVAGLIEKRLGDLDAAAALLRRAVAVDPRDYKSWMAVSAWVWLWLMMLDYGPSVLHELHGTVLCRTAVCPAFHFPVLSLLVSAVLSMGGVAEC